MPIGRWWGFDTEGIEIAGKNFIKDNRDAVTEQSTVWAIEVRRCLGPGVVGDGSEDEPLLN